ncbi:MAG: hypothetical protein Q9173_006293 [Seirophora scorigena]|nr:MAG: hypothetical protein LQ344_003813 [Seirophora lacunosa]KAI4116767.1 MAG: hypothetical protein LQ345_002859 [Seirophora villosa]
MASTDPSQSGAVTNPTQSVVEKGKGKAVDTPQDVSMGEDEDDSSDQETGAEEDEPEQADEDEDDQQEIDPSNIVGSRTRGKAIDYNKVDPAEFPEDDEDDDDDDFEDPDANPDAMQE